MTYWLVWTTFFWLNAFGAYPSLEECEKAMQSTPWYVSADCMPTPTRQRPALKPVPPAAAP